MSSTGARNSSRSVFTANQWQELEHQALIFKHMVSGVPVPPQLLHSLKTTSSLQPPNHLLVSHHHHHQQQQQEQTIGWGCFQAGFGRKADPEPGRCRRTDGKKWRCSKEAHPDSKYCEKHMHRGRNRSRKPVELEPTNSSAPAHPAGTLTLNRESLLSFPTSTSSAMPLMPSSSSPHAIYTHHNPHNYHSCNPMYPHFFDSSRAGIPQDYRLYYHGARDAVSVDKRAFFPGASSGNMQRPLATAADANGGSYNDQIYGNIYSTKQEQQQQQPIQEQCFVLGADIKSFRFMRPGNQDHETQKPAVHHQFLEDWDSPPEDHLGHSTNWLDLASNPRASK